MPADFDTYKVTDGETSSATKFDAFVQATEDGLNDIGGTGTAFASGQILGLDQLTQSGATTGQAAVWSGSAWEPTTLSGALFRDTSLVTVAGTTTLTDLFNNAATISANEMGTEKRLRATLYGDYLNNSGSSRTIRCQVVFGGVTILEDRVGDLGGAGIADDTVRRPVKIVLDIMNLGVADEQFATLEFSLGGTLGNTSVTGIGDLGGLNKSSDEAIQYAIISTQDTTAVDTTANCDLLVNVTHSNNAATISLRCYYRMIEVT